MQIHMRILRSSGANATRSTARIVVEDTYIRGKSKGGLTPPTATSSRWIESGILISMSRPSIVPSIDEFRLPKFDFEHWSMRCSVYSQGTNEDEKALIDFNKCQSESVEDWSSVGLPISSTHFSDDTQRPRSCSPLPYASLSSSIQLLPLHFQAEPSSTLRIIFTSLTNNNMPFQYRYS